MFLNKLYSNHFMDPFQTLFVLHFILTYKGKLGLNALFYGKSSDKYISSSLLEDQKYFLPVLATHRSDV